MAESETEKKGATVTEYVVQRRLTSGDLPSLSEDDGTDAQIRNATIEACLAALDGDVWIEIGKFSATTAERAMKAAHGPVESAVSGQYRAFPSRNDSRLTANFKREVVATYD